MCVRKEILNNFNILRYVNEKQFNIGNYKRRINEDESLNTYVFERNDGMREMYVFDDNVKFVDPLGASPTAQTATLMWHYRNRLAIHSPTEFDIHNVELLH